MIKLTSNAKAVITLAEVVSAYGDGSAALFDGLYSSVSAVTLQSGKPVPLYQMYPVGAITGIADDDARLFNILRRLAGITGKLPGEAPLYLAVTIGAIDLLEQQILSGSTGEPHLKALTKIVKQLFGERRVIIVSGACAASACAVARAAADIDAGRTDCAIVLSCDALSEFIFSGFASLGALDQQPARPFDRNRAGLNLGEAAAIMVLQSPRLPGNEKNLGSIAGWALSSDAIHVTSPDPEGCGLARAIRSAIAAAKITPSDISFIAAHGTGTQYNDTMELAAFHQVFEQPRPVFSVKWGTGHTIAAAGMVQLIVACNAKKIAQIPPNALTLLPEDNATGWVSSSATAVSDGCMLSVNSGFGGINSALVLF
ncbi:MAG: beta-ketoacyl synthase N-terminal-like domain-containing protein [Victivallaceae bacterium]|jgi:3-oxoacyl-[acyl-carrier-protein] synthase III